MWSFFRAASLDFSPQNLFKLFCGGCKERFLIHFKICEWCFSTVALFSIQLPFSPLKNLSQLHMNPSFAVSHALENRATAGIICIHQSA